MTTEAFDYSKLDHPAVLQMLFHPRKDSGSSPPANATDYDITLEEGIKVGARFYMADGKAPNILFFHGNGEIVEDYDPVGPIYNEYAPYFQRCSEMAEKRRTDRSPPCYGPFPWKCLRVGVGGFLRRGNGRYCH